MARGSIGSFEFGFGVRNGFKPFPTGIRSRLGGIVIWDFKQGRWSKNDMAASMRLMRFGGKKSPYYRIVVSDRRSSRDGKFIDQVGTYDPKKDPAEVRFKEEKAIQWLRKGAQPTPTVRQLLIRSGISKKLTEEKAE
jgi:small subunit ribosomal protein S16